MKLPSILLRLRFPNRDGKARLEPIEEPDLVGDFEEPEPEDRLQGDGEKAQVLVLDWHMGMRKLYASYLRQYHYGYRVVGSTEELETEMAAQLPDLVILDHRSPQIGGFALASTIKEANPDLPIILCTRFGDLSAYEEFKRSKADRFLIKPLRKEELVRAIQELLVKVPLKKEAAADGEGLEESPQLPEPTQPIPAKKKPGRRRVSFLDGAEELHKQFLDSNATREVFAKKHNVSVSKLQNEIRLAQMPDEVKKLIREDASAFKKSFFEHLLKLKNVTHLHALCLEIREQGRQGNFYDLKKVVEKVAGYLALEKRSKRPKTPPKDTPVEALAAHE